MMQAMTPTQRRWWLCYFLFALAFFVFALAYAAHAQDPPVRRGQVNVTSSSAGVLITDRIKYSLKVGVPNTAAASVCFAFVDPGTPCSTVTSAAMFAPCVPAGHGYEWPLRIYGYTGSVCGILETGSTPVAINWSDP